ncbi:tyrosine-type recombinase/integrase [Fictibacillus enclensis]|uniref:tyrosine-type recombinase/integrase n=1 Tax=Fictibacillus enclensis TaxID=1017270 RepID=UPI0025A2AD30|nr:tyrosine-type recombinase/integrase [Fictibacillus enclensis]MDM5336363.1 tyrosine-type recombinase/integrase [Fictibacillus enclensis]
MVGTNTALLISDILNIKVSDVVDRKGNPVDFYELREKKTKKLKLFPINGPIKKALKEYMKEYNPEPEDYLFQSKKGSNEPINRKTAWFIIKDAAETVGVNDKIGTHSLRKTFAYFAYKNGHSLELIQKILNHDSPADTIK